MSTSERATRSIRRASMVDAADRPDTRGPVSGAGRAIVRVPRFRRMDAGNRVRTDRCAQEVSIANVPPPILTPTWVTGAARPETDRAGRRRRRSCLAHAPALTAPARMTPAQGGQRQRPARRVTAP